MIEIKKKLSEITEVIRKNNCTAAGLLGGHAGFAVFYANANQLYTDPILNDEMENSLEKSLLLFEQANAIHTFGDGFAGVCWGMNQLVIQNKVDADINSLFEEIEPYLVSSSENDLVVNFFDFLHGGLGACIYFLDRSSNSTAKEHLKKTVLSLEEQAIVADDGIYWNSSQLKTGDKSQKKDFNLGLSHGIPSIIWFLSKCYENDIEKEKCGFLLNDSVNWLINQKIKKQSISIYPAVIIDGKTTDTSRLAWCYGDLGIAACLWQAGKALKNEKWKQESLNIILHACNRKNLEENSVLDAGVCHGTAGIAHIFNRFYFETKIPAFKETANYWINETLKMARHEDGLAGFKTWDHEKGWLNEYGLLEGVTGIGLVLLSHITNEEPTWDRCLLLS